MASFNTADTAAFLEGFRSEVAQYDLEDDLDAALRRYVQSTSSTSRTPRMFASSSSSSSASPSPYTSEDDDEREAAKDTEDEGAEENSHYEGYSRGELWVARRSPEREGSADTWTSPGDNEGQSTAEAVERESRMSEASQGSTTANSSLLSSSTRSEFDDKENVFLTSLRASRREAPKASPPQESSPHEDDEERELREDRARHLSELEAELERMEEFRSRLASAQAAHAATQAELHLYVNDVMSASDSTGERLLSARSEDLSSLAPAASYEELKEMVDVDVFVQRQNQAAIDADPSEELAEIAAGLEKMRVLELRLLEATREASRLKRERKAREASEESSTGAPTRPGTQESEANSDTSTAVSSGSGNTSARSSTSGGSSTGRAKRKRDEKSGKVVTSSLYGLTDLSGGHIQRNIERLNDARFFSATEEQLKTVEKLLAQTEGEEEAMFSLGLTPEELARMSEIESRLESLSLSRQASNASLALSTSSSNSSLASSFSSFGPTPPATPPSPSPSAPRVLGRSPSSGGSATAVLPPLLSSSSSVSSAHPLMALASRNRRAASTRHAPKHSKTTAAQGESTAPPSTSTATSETGRGGGGGVGGDAEEAREFEAMRDEYLRRQREGRELQAQLRDVDHRLRAVQTATVEPASQDVIKALLLAALAEVGTEPGAAPELELLSSEEVAEHLARSPSASLSSTPRHLMGETATSTTTAMSPRRQHTRPVSASVLSQALSGVASESAHRPASSPTSTQAANSVERPGGRPRPKSGQTAAQPRGSDLVVHEWTLPSPIRSTSARPGSAHSVVPPIGSAGPSMRAEDTMPRRSGSAEARRSTPDTTPLPRVVKGGRGGARDSHSIY